MERSRVKNERFFLIFLVLKFKFQDLVQNTFRDLKICICGCALDFEIFLVMTSESYLDKQILWKRLQFFVDASFEDLFIYVLLSIMLDGPYQYHLVYNAKRITRNCDDRLIIKDNIKLTD